MGERWLSQALIDQDPGYPHTRHYLRIYFFGLLSTMDDVIDFTTLSLALPDIADTPAASSGTSDSLVSTPLSTSSSGSTGGIGLVQVLGCFIVKR